MQFSVFLSVVCDVFQLGIDISLVRVTYTCTEKVVNGGVTGGSGTSEVIVQAAMNACDVLNDRLEEFRIAASASTAAAATSRGSRRKRAGEWCGVLASICRYCRVVLCHDPKC